MSFYGKCAVSVCRVVRGGRFTYKGGERMKKVVIIGGGLGGVSAAISLKQRGYDVALYEQNGHIGGKLNRLEQDGFGFDLGPSILTMPHIFETLFTRSGKRMSDYVAIERLPHQWRSFFQNGTVLDLHEDIDEMLRRNSTLTKKDMQQYEQLLAYAKRLYDATEEGYFDKGLDDLGEIMQHHGAIRALRQFDVGTSMYDGIAKYVKNKQFRDMLSYIVKYVGSSSYDAPTVLNMMLYMQHKQGIWYVKGGMHHLGNALAKLADEIGVQLHMNKKVVKFDTEKRRVTAAHLDDGTKLEADYFVSNMEVIPAYEELTREKESYTTKLRDKFEPASSGLVLHLGVNKQYPQLAHHNFFFADDMKRQMKRIFKQHILPDDPVIYLVNVNKTDETQALPGHENLKILPHIPYLQDGAYTRQQYEQFAEVVLDKLERLGLTDLRKHIVTKDMWTPHDIQRTYSSDRGAIYGTVSDKKKNKGFKHKKQSELYDNLFFVGGTVNPGGGMPMVTLSGQQVADKIVAQRK